MVMALVGGNIVYTWWVNREKVTSSKFRLLEQRLAEVEFAVRQTPPCCHHDELDRRLTSLLGEVREMSGTLKGLNRAVDLMNEHLLNRGNP
ncbi:MAG: hypothetical protein PHC98_09845 [Syntrophotalea acetylenica]|nr:hypothetical protein [Syntrophotalea acetylenica]